MSILAGIYNRRKDHSLPRAVCETLKNLISRNPEDKVIVFSDARCFLAKIDIGAYGGPAFHIDSSGSVSMLAGEPLLDLDDNEAFRTRTQDLELLNQSWDRADFSLLAKTRGVFCAVHYQPTSGQVLLITDKLGVRPMYYWANDEYIIFSSVLRVLEGLAAVPKEMDLRAVTEIAALGYPLGDRTPYVNVIRLKPGEVVRVSDHGVARSQYWRWDNIPVSTHSEQELLRNVYETFIDSVTRRIRTDKITVATLSGGLDSRCIVAALRDNAMSVHTFNFSPEGSQDQMYGAAFARAVGTIHNEDSSFLNEIPLDAIEPALYTVTVAKLLRSYRGREPWPPERQQLIWSGDGGSVGLGHVYLSKGVTESLQAGNQTGAIDVYLKEYGARVLVRLLKSDVAASLETSVKQGILEELDAICCEDPVRGFYIFLMFNDQRRHLSSHYETIDAHRLELQLPFYDGKFLQSILEVPITLCLRHVFYTKLLAQFPSVVRSVPWQAYPGHEPCPLPVPAGLTHQWHPSTGRRLSKQLKPKLLQECSKMLRSDNFPSPILSKGHLRFATWIFRTGLRDYGYVIQVAGIYYKYWILCAGKVQK